MGNWIINSNEYNIFFLKLKFIIYIYQFMVFKKFQNHLLLYQWHHITFYVKKITELNILINIMSP
jgi:hypothetical protein